MSDIETLKRRIDVLERRLVQMPDRLPVKGPIPTIIQVKGGNTIYTIGGNDWKGILPSGTLSSVPVAVPVLGSTYANGLGYGYIINANGTFSASLAWICNSTVTDTGGTNWTSAIGFPVGQDIPISSVYKVIVNCAAGGTSIVYVVNRVG